MNRLEAEYAQRLKEQHVAGKIHWYGFELYKLKLAKNTTFCPDFAVLDGNDELIFVEVKGFMHEDAWQKLKIAADMFPHRFILAKKRAKKDGGGWDEKEVGA